MSPISLWLADYQLLAAALLLGVMLAIAALRQPAQRLAVAKSTLAALAALAILCALPGWSLVHLLSDDAPIVEPAASRTEPTPAYSSTLSTIEPTPNLFNTQPPESPAGAVLHTNSRNAVEPASPISWSTYIITAYAAGSAAVTLWLITGALLAHRVRRQATPAPPELQALLQQLCGEEKRAPQILISPHITAPVALGLRHPTILLPATFGEVPYDVAAPSPWRGGLGRGENPSKETPRDKAITPPPAPPHQGEGRKLEREVQLLPILAHELAHLQHRDLHTLAATRLLLALLWPQPLYWLLRRTIRLDQETLADAAAADRAGRLDYAQQLLAWASSASTQRPPRLAGAIGLWEGPSQLKRRIAVLLNEQFQVMSTCSMRWRWLSVSCIAALVAALSLVTLQPATDAAEDEVAIATLTPSEVVMARKNELLRGIVREKNSVRGYCVDEHGKPLAGAKISLFDYRSSDHTGRPRVFRETLSDQRGYFSIDAAIDVEQAKLDGILVDKPFDPANGWSPITINAHAPGRAASYDHIPTVLLVQDGDLRMFELRPGKSLSGKVTDAAGRPVAGVQVTAGGYVLSSATTDANGDYEIRDLYPMDGTPGHQLTSVEFRHPNFALQKAGPATVPGKLDVTLQPGGDIAGRVEIQDGASIRPAANVDVMVALFTPYTPGQNPPPNVPGAQYSRIIDREWVRTNDAGEYRIQSLAPGDYGVTIVQNELVTNGVAPVVVKPQETTNAPPIPLARGVRIRVKLIDAETKQPISFDKQTRGVVTPILSSPTTPSMQMRREFKPYGDFGEVNVAPGAYSLFATNRSERLESVNDRQSSGDYPAYHEFQAEEGKDLEFVVPMRVSSSDFVDPSGPAAPGSVIETLDEVSSAEAVPAGDASVSSKPASETSHQSLGMATIQAVPINPPKHQPNALELHIVDENKQPLAGVEATLYSAASRTGDAKPIKTLTTDDAGNVVFAAVVSADQIAKFEKMKAAGEFIGGSQESYLVALKRPGLATALVYQSAGELALAGGKRTIMLRPAVKLSGRVTDPEGKPVPNAVVTAGSWAGTRNIDGVNTATTDADGRYVFTDRATFNRDAARRENSFATFAATAVNPPASQKDPTAPEDPSAAEVSTLVVTHPDFAVTRIEGGDVPGGADVEMLPAASIIGRVVHHETGAPVAGAAVRAMGEPTEPPQPKQQDGVVFFAVPHTHSAATKTDEQGNYRLANLPAGTYNLWVEAENSLNEPFKMAARGVAGVVAAAGAEPTPAPDSFVGPPPAVTAKLIDAATGQPLRIDGEVVAVPMALRADNPRLQAPSHQRIPLSKDGTFSFHVLPGKFRLGVEVVEKPGTDYRVLYRSPDDFHSSGSVVDFNFGEDISIELPVYPMTKLEQFRSEHAKAYQLLEEKKFDEAIAAFNKMIAEWPDAHEPLTSRCFAYRRAGHYAEAIADAELLLKRFPDDAWSKHMLADLLASSPVEGTRDGKRALQFAEEVVAIAKADHSYPSSIARYLELVAAAHAELGEFAKAVAIQQEAIAQAAADQKEGMGTRLKLYQADKPFRRETPATPKNEAAKKPASQGASTTSNPRMPFWTVPASLDLKLTVTGVPPAKADGILIDSRATENETWRLLPESALKVGDPATLQEAVQ